MTYDLNTPAVGRLWPYEPDWSNGYEVSREFLTDIITSRNRTEQRRALRDVPRMAVRYETALSGDTRRAAELALKAAQNLPAVVPDFTRYAELTGTSSATDTTLTLSSPPVWVEADHHLVLCGAGGLTELVIVDSVAGSTITLTEGLANDWPSGSVVRPGLFGLLGSALTARWPRPDVSLLELELDVYPGGEPTEDEGTAGTTLGGLEVLTNEPDYSARPSMEHILPVEQIDFGRGRTAQFRPTEQDQSVLECEFTGRAASEVRGIEQFFLRHKGQRDAFYRSTCRPDMDLASDVTGTTITVSGDEIATEFSATDYSEVAQAVEIVQTDGTRIHRTVTNIALSGSNTTITLNSSVTVTTATTARISWMPKVRFATDRMTSKWITPDLADVRCAFRTVLA